MGPRMSCVADLAGDHICAMLEVKSGIMLRLVATMCFRTEAHFSSRLYYSSSPVMKAQHC